MSAFSTKLSAAASLVHGDDDLSDVIVRFHLAMRLGSASACIDVVGGCDGNRFVAMATPPASFDGVPAGRGRMRRLLPILTRMLTRNVGLAVRARRKGVRTKFIWGSALDGNEVGPMIYETFLPEALAQKHFVAAIPPIVVGPRLRIHSGGSRSAA